MLNAREPKIVNGPQILDKYVGESEANIRYIQTRIYSYMDRVVDTDRIDPHLDPTARTTGSGSDLIKFTLNF